MAQSAGTPRQRQKLKISPALPSSNYSFIKAAKGFAVEETDNDELLIKGIWVLDPVSGNPIQIATLGPVGNQVLALEVSPVQLDISNTVGGALSAVAFSPLQQCVIAHAEGTSLHAAAVYILDLRDVHSTLSITATANAGTFTLVVESSVDGTNWVTIDSVALAGSQAKQYDNTHLGTTLAVNPLSFRFLRVTVGDAGAGNTTTTFISAK